MDSIEPSTAPGPPAVRVTTGQDLPEVAFQVAADRIAARADDVALFAQSGRSFEGWCLWEIVAACHAAGAGWTVQPRPKYAEAGVTGSREYADLLIFDPARGTRVLVEVSVISDWSRNQWIDDLDGDTLKLSRPLSPGIVPIQLILAASLASPIHVNPVWQQWLGMSNVWNRPTDLRRSLPLGPVGELSLTAWVLGG